MGSTAPSRSVSKSLSPHVQEQHQEIPWFCVLGQLFIKKVEVEEPLSLGGGLGGLPLSTWHIVCMTFTVMELGKLAKQSRRQVKEAGSTWLRRLRKDAADNMQLSHRRCSDLQQGQEYLSETGSAGCADGSPGRRVIRL